MSTIASPLSTYRIQFSPQFTFADAERLVPYLNRLGITWLYSSPVFRARPGSTHGYDVVDPTLINSEIGDEAAFKSLATTLHNYGMGLLLDIVPNHMATSTENPYWKSVLTYGPGSPYAQWFDINWRQAQRQMWSRVVMPILGDSLLKIIAQDEIKISWERGRFIVQYHDHFLPIDPAAIPDILEFCLQELTSEAQQPQVNLERLTELAHELKQLPGLRERLRQELDISAAESALSRIAQLVDQSQQLSDAIVRSLAQFGLEDTGRNRLRKLLDRQPYRLVHWRAAATVMNYRRFFAINELVSVRQEDPQVFHATHELVKRWLGEGLVDGLRVDHIDGLRDPLGYLQQLRTLANENPDRPHVPIFVEKILAVGETVPSKWPVEGTTGYEFISECEPAFVDPSGFRQLEVEYNRLVGRKKSFNESMIDGKRYMLKNDLAPAVGQLADILLRLTEQQSEFDFGNADLQGTQDQPNAVAIPNKKELARAIIEVIASLRIYRTYVDSEPQYLSEQDEHWLRQAVDEARERNGCDSAALDALEQVLFLQQLADLPANQIQERIRFVQKFQQLSGPAAAKGVEDTALYTYVPLVSLNEVGGGPDVPLDQAVSRLHEINSRRADCSPLNMLAASTHDTKRSADMRCRLHALSEIPRQWIELVRTWTKRHRKWKQRLGRRVAPDPSLEYLLYQTIVGIWPANTTGIGQKLPIESAELNALQERIEQYMVKAMREAKLNSSWSRPNPEYEQAVIDFIRKLFGEDNSARSFVREVSQLVAWLANPGYWNSLARTLIQFTAPGSPDLYQGDELWDFSLVDPDNRRPVDFDHRMELLDQIAQAFESDPAKRATFVESLWKHPHDGRIKLHVIRQALHARREHPQLFLQGSYSPLFAEGAKAEHVIAFHRQHEGEHLLTIVPRLTVRLCKDPTQPPLSSAAWGDTVLNLPDAEPERQWKCLLTEQMFNFHDRSRIALAEVFAQLPIALLASGP